MMTSLSTPSDINTFFNQQWQTYHRVLSHNYMKHRELATLLNDYLLATFPRAYSLLDLGCGDASFSVEALRGTPLASYVGVDLSQPALDLAAVMLREIRCRQHLLHGEISAVASDLLAQNRSFDAILASFSIHHLSLDAKDQLIGTLRSLLNPGGVFLMIDLVARSGETRGQFLKRYITGVRSTWTALEDDEIESIAEHIESCDFPESCETFRKLAVAHGCKFDCLRIAPSYTDQFLCFRV